MIRQEFAEIVAAVRTGEPGATLKLWENTRRFVAKAANRWARSFNGRVAHEDLMQAGFLAVMDAAERYDPERENGSFLSVLWLTMRTRFAEESGVRTTKRDALQYADSLEAPAYGDEDGPAVADTLPDESASLAFTGVEYGDFLPYCRGIIGAAMESLTERQAEILRLRYLDGLPLEDVARMSGLSSKQAVSAAEERALDRLARGKYRRRLRECMDTLKDFRADREAARSCLYSAASHTETAALRNIAGRN